MATTTYTPSSYLSDANPLVTLLNADVTAQNYSPAAERFRYYFHTVQVIAPSGGSATLFGSLDGVSWVPVSAAATAMNDGALVSVNGAYRYLIAQRSNDTNPVTVILQSSQSVR